MIYAGRRLLPISSVVKPTRRFSIFTARKHDLQIVVRRSSPTLKSAKNWIYRFGDDEYDDQEDIDDYDIV